VTDRNSRRPPGPMPLGGAIMRRLSQVGPPPCSAKPVTAYFPHVREAALPTELSPMEGEQESRRRLVRRVYAVREAAGRAPVRYSLWLLLTPAASIAVSFRRAAKRFGLGRGQARKNPCTTRHEAHRRHVDPGAGSGQTRRCPAI
jgi:hypothetical protein